MSGHPVLGSSKQEMTEVHMEKNIGEDELDRMKEGRSRSCNAAGYCRQGCTVLVSLWDANFRVRKLRIPDSDSRLKIRL